MRNDILGYINDSLKAILVNEVKVTILKEQQMNVYDRTNGLPDNLITYRIDDMLPYTRTKKYIDVDDGNLFHESTNYKVSCFIDVYGTNADNLMRKIFNNVNKNDNTFSEHNLGILNYEGIQNLTFIENSEYKERLGLPITFDYIDDVALDKQGYLVQEVELDVENVELS